MKDFFENALRDLEALTGKKQVYYWQTETDIDKTTGKTKGARKFEVCVQGMVMQSQNFPYIPEADQKRIISEMMVKDQDYEALNSSVVYKWLSMYKDKYFTESNAPEREPLRERTKEENDNIDRLAKEYLAQLAGAFQHEFKALEKDIAEIKREDKARIENKAISTTFKQNDEYVRIQERKLVVAKARGLDKLTAAEVEDLPIFELEGKKIIARNLEEAQEIYLEVYE